MRIVADHNLGPQMIIKSSHGHRMKGRNIDDIVDGTLGDNAFFEKFLTDLNDIETINNRVERDIQYRV